MKEDNKKYLQKKQAQCLKAFFWGFLGLNFSTDKFFCKTNS